MREFDIHAEDEAAMEALGGRLSRALAGGGTVWLDGTLGAGKTTLARGALRGLGYTGAVKSPTYTLVEPYELPGVAVYHFDLYRMQDPEELELMGFRDYCRPENLLLVEWPERGRGLMPAPDIHAEITVIPDGRMIHFKALSARGETALAKLTT